MKILLLLLLSGSVAFGQLEWRDREIRVRAGFRDEKVTAQFKFKNTGADPVTVTSVTSSCGCTTAELSKKEFAPGEAGEITARFDVGGRKGLQNKKITVVTNRDHGTPTDLTLLVDIPALLEMEPTLLYWRIGDPPAAKEMSIRVPQDSPVKVIGVVSSNSNVRAELESKGPGQYVVRATPKDTSKRDDAELSLRVESAVRIPRKFSGRVVIR